VTTFKKGFVVGAGVTAGVVLMLFAIGVIQKAV
jgi:hypothetical protein